jgi:hypothetical protein
MAGGRTFISYSRRQFYFAEALALALQDSGVRIWFDVQSLKPGHNWAADIQAGLEDCENLVLIASPASLASEYVRAEWTQALSACKPVYVVMFEAVTLPPSLAHLPVFDFRRGFDKRVKTLVQAIKGDQVSGETAPRPNPFRFPTRLPWGVTVTSLALTITLLLLLAIPAALYLFILRGQKAYGDLPEALALILSTGLFWTMLTGTLAYLWWAFLYRRIKFEDLRGFLGAAPILLYVCYRTMVGLTDFFDHGGSLAMAMSSPPPYFFELFFPAFLAVLVLDWGTFLLIVRNRSADLFRWLPTGEAPSSLRGKLVGARSRPVKSIPKVSAPIRKSYRLYYDPGDADIAAEVKEAMNRRHIFRADDDSGPVDTHLAILTNNVRKEWVEQVLSAHAGNLVCVVATSIQMPDDLAWIHTYQWVDYRRRSFEQLLRMANTLAESEETQTVVSPGVVPENFAKLVTPQKVAYFANSLKILAALNIGLGLASLGPGSANQSLIQAAGGLFIGAVLFWLAGKLLGRTLTFRALLATFVAGWLLMLLSGLGWRLLRLGGTGISVFGAIFLIGPLVALAIYFETLRRWLPAIAPRRTRTGPTLAASFRLQGSDLLYLLAAIWLALIF